MAATKKVTEKEQVNLHISKLDPAISKTVEKIRQLILSCDNKIGERIKWNNPSFYYTGEMKPFDPKEYKREIAIFNLYKGRIMLLFPSGARVKDTTGFLTGDYKDDRRIAVFKNMTDVNDKEKIIKRP